MAQSPAGSAGHRGPDCRADPELSSAARAGIGSLTIRILLATLGLLALVSSASAEGAWVLWSQLSTPGAGDWMMQTAYSTATECTEAVDYREVLTPKNGLHH